MIDTTEYLLWLTGRLSEAFGSRLKYVGLQGSYLRGEAEENSDFDVMLVLENLTPADLDVYREILRSGNEYDRSCGFVCGLDELRAWNPLERRHVLHATKDIFGCLAELLPAGTGEEQRNFILLSLCNLYHELCHRYIHRSRERNIAAFPRSCRSLFFILQNLHDYRCGQFAETKMDLLQLLEGEDREIFRLSMALKAEEPYDFDAAYSRVLEWCQRTICELGENTKQAL